MSAGISASRSTAPNRLPAASDGWSAFTARVGISLLWSAMLATAIGAVYSGGLRGGMILDDSVIITNNPSIRSLRHLGQVLNPPHDGSPVQGRPVMNLSLALGYALGRENVFGYHLFNVTIHLLNALLLFGVVVVLAAYHVGRSLLARPAFAWALSAGLRKRDRFDYLKIKPVPFIALLAIAIGAVYAGGLRRGMILDDTVIIPRGG